MHHSTQLASLVPPGARYGFDLNRPRGRREFSARPQPAGHSQGPGEPSGPARGPLEHALGFAAEVPVERNLTVDPSRACYSRWSVLSSLLSLTAWATDHSGCNDLRQSLSCGMLVATV